MPLVAIAVLIGAAAGFAAGGRMANLQKVDVRLVGLPVLWAALSAWAHRGVDGLHFAALLVSMSALLAFLLANLRRLPGVWLVALGVGLNLFMTANNHGIPYSPAALEAAGIAPPTFDAVARSTVASHPRRPGDQLVVLGGAIPLRPLRQVVTFGDLFVAFGFGTVVMNGLLGRRDGRRRLVIHLPRHGRVKAAVSSADPSLPEASVVVSVAASEVASELSAAGSTRPVSAGDPLIDRLPVVALLNDEWALIDLAGPDGATFDESDLAARSAVRSALRKNGLTVDLPGLWAPPSPDPLATATSADRP